MADGSRKSMSSLSLGDRVLALDEAGNPTFSPVLLFLERAPDEETVFRSLSLSNGDSLELTSLHLLYVAPTNASFDGELFRNLVPMYARDVQIGHYVFVLENGISGSHEDGVHYGTKPGHFETSKICFPTSKGVSEVSERANE